MDAVFDADYTGNFELYRLVAGVAQPITNDGGYDSWWARLSPDGTRILFMRTPAGVHDLDYTQTSLWMVDIDGTGLHEVIARGAFGSKAQGHPWWHPSGHSFIHWMDSLGICTFSENGLLQLGGLDMRGGDPIFAPDGRIYYIKPSDGSAFLTADPATYRIWRMRSDGTLKHRLINLAHRMNDPCVSRDGKKIAWEANDPAKGFGVWDLWIANIDGTNAHLLFSDNLINTNPVFGADGKVWFYKTKFFVNGFAVHRINQDGTGLEWMTPHQTSASEMVYPS